MNESVNADAVGASSETPSISALREQLKETRQRLDVLQAERASLAFPALNKKQPAIKRIAEIDAERTELASHVETIEQAIVASRQLDPDAEKRNRIFASFERDLPRYRDLLEAVFAEKVSTFSRNIRLYLDRGELSTAAKTWVANYHNANFHISSVSELGTVEDVYRRLLLEAAADLCRVQDAEIIPALFKEGEAAAEKRKAAGVKLRAAMIAKLIERHKIKPPAHLVEVHAVFLQKLTSADDAHERQAEFDERQRIASDPLERRRMQQS